jgi:glycosyltransferase involved in cell wall biosynthesis
VGLRILLASDFYPPLIGGAEHQTQLLAEELAARDHEVLVATVWHDGLRASETDGRVTVRRMKGLALRLPWAFADPIRRRYHPPFPDPAIAFELLCMIREFRPDVVHASAWIGYSARLATALTRVPLVLSARDFGYGCPVRTLQRHGVVCSGPGLEKCLRNATVKYGAAKGLVAVSGVLGLRRWLLRGVVRIHVLSSYVERIERRDLLRSDDDGMIALIPDMIRLSEPGASPTLDPDRLLARLPDRPFILFVGALQPHKGIGPLLSAYGRLLSPPPLVVVGTTWPDSPTSWPSGTTVLTNVNHRLVQEIWARSMFGIAPSLVPETFGGVVIEAMLAGRAIIASSLGGPMDTVEDGRTGLLVAPGDVDGLKRSMQTLIDDPSLRDRMGLLARERVERFFSTDAVVPQYEAFYANVVAASQDGRQHP